MNAVKLFRIIQKAIVFVVFVTLIQTKFVKGQEADAPVEDSLIYYSSKPLRFEINEKEGYFINFFGSLQTWFRDVQLNPGSIVANNTLAKSATDISIRRFRLGMNGVIAHHTFFMFTLGVNNINYQSERNTSLNVLDAYSEFRPKTWFNIGAGKSGWKGLSRYSSPSTTRGLGLDVPVVAQPTLNVTDDLLRNLSVYVKGQVKRLDYRVVFFKPLAVENGGSFAVDPVEGIANFTDSKLSGAFGTSAYVKLHLLEKESNSTPFAPGTYLGEKEMLTVGVGFETENNRTFHLENGELKYNDMLLGAVDVFYEKRISTKRKDAITLYGAVFIYNFGPNFIRSIGSNNPAIGVDPNLATVSGAGNAFPAVGTGESGYLQIGYLSKEVSRGTLQPYVAIQAAQYDYLDDWMTVYDLGINWYLKSYLSRLSLNYQWRPIFEKQAQAVRRTSFKGQFIIQYQFRIK